LTSTTEKRGRLELGKANEIFERTPVLPALGWAEHGEGERRGKTKILVQRGGVVKNGRKAIMGKATTGLSFTGFCAEVKEMKSARASRG